MIPKTQKQVPGGKLWGEPFKREQTVWQRKSTHAQDIRRKLLITPVNPFLSCNFRADSNLFRSCLTFEKTYTITRSLYIYKNRIL